MLQYYPFKLNQRWGWKCRILVSFHTHLRKIQALYIYFKQHFRCHKFKREMFKFLISCKNKEKPLYRPRWPMGQALSSSFLNMKWPGVLLLPPGWDVSPSQGYPLHICWYPFVHLGEEKHCESKVSCLRTQHNDPSQGSNPDHLIRSQAH